MSSLGCCNTDKKRRNVPFDFTEEVLRLGDVDVWWNIVGERIRGRSDGHGDARQLAINLRRKRTTDGALFTVTDYENCVFVGLKTEPP